MTEQPRTRAERMRDTMHRLQHDVDGWVATAGGGTPHLVPLSFLWTDASLLLATGASSPTTRNVAAAGLARIGIGPVRDLVLIEGRVEVLQAEDVSPALGDAFAAKSGFDPRTLSTPYAYLRVIPIKIQAWREENELPGRDLMRDGRWLR